MNAFQVVSVDHIVESKTNPRRTFDEAKLAELANGITIEGIRYGSIQASLDRQQRSNAWIDIALAEDLEPLGDLSAALLPPYQKPG